MASAVVRADADRHHDEVGRDLAAVLEPDARDPVLADDRVGVGLRDDLDAARLDRLLEQIAGRRVELALHQRRHQVEDGHRPCRAGEARGRFEPEQAAADHHGAAAAAPRREHPLDVVEVAEGDDAGQVLARAPGR